MKKTIFLLAVFLLATAVSAYQWEEAVPVHSKERQEARIDGFWQIIEPTNSFVNGFFAYPKPAGKITAFFEGHDIQGKYRSIDSKVVVTSVVQDGNLFWLYGNGSMIYNSGGKILPLENVSFTGMFNPDSNQIYLSYHHPKIGLTWVNFVNGH